MNDFELTVPDLYKYFSLKTYFKPCVKLYYYASVEEKRELDTNQSIFTKFVKV